MMDNSGDPAVPTAGGPAALEAHSWGWRYATRMAWAGREATFRIEPGERVLLLGASGAGKSTLLQGLAGVLGGAEEGEHEGALLVDGLPAAGVRGRVGMVLQDPDTQTILARVGDDVAFGCENLGVPRAEIWARVRHALDQVGLDVALDRSTSALSGGQKQRLALAGVVAMRPGAILLDEPTANLDPPGVLEVRDAVGRVLDATGATLVVIEHRIDAWLPVVDRVIVLGTAGVVADGAPDAVLGARGAELAAAGVWVPGHAPAVPAAPVSSPGEALVVAQGLVVGRRPGVGRALAASGSSGLGRATETAVARPAAPEGGSGGVASLPGPLPPPILPPLLPEGAVAGPIDLEIRAGEVLGITGANGAGKSTLGLTLAGLLAPLGGEVVASPSLAAGVTASRSRSARRRARRTGSAVRSDDPYAWSSRELLTRIGTVFQEPEHQLLARTVREELEVGPRALGLDETVIAARVEELLERLRLSALARANPYTLSGGEKRRLTVAAMLATRPRVVVLDEPTFGQDARTWAELVAIIAGLRDGADGGEPLAITAVTHDEAVLDALRARRFALRSAS